MDRLLKITAPIRIKLSENCYVDGLSLPAGNEAGPQLLLQQLSGSVWGYFLDNGRLCLVTRSATIISRLARTGAECMLVVDGMTATNPQDVTAAFRDGGKIVAEWVPVEPGNVFHTGAAELWAVLEGAGIDANIVMPPVTSAPPASGQTVSPPPGRAGNLESFGQERIAPAQPMHAAKDTGPYMPQPGAGEAAPAKNGGPILPQSEIDLLVQSLLASRENAAAQAQPLADREDAPSGPPLFQAQPSPPVAPAPQVQPLADREDAPSGPPLFQAQPSPTVAPAPQIQPPAAPTPPESTPGFDWRIGAEHDEVDPEPSVPAVISPNLPPLGAIDATTDLSAPTDTRPEIAPEPSVPEEPEICLEDWTDTSFSATAIEHTRQMERTLSSETASLLPILPAEQSYILIIFANHQLFQHQLPLLREGYPGNMLALWAGEMVFNRLGQAHMDNLHQLQAKYRTAAAEMQKELTRLRQLEQMLPNLQGYRQQQVSVADEITKIEEDMRILRLKQVLQTNDGRYLARKAFEIDSRRQSALRGLASDSYKMLRHAAPSILSRSRYARAMARFLSCQRQLEECLTRLSKLEREIQRRLEYQADWQALVKRQSLKERELEEIRRFIQGMAVHIPGGTAADPDAVAKWLRTSRETAKKRELLLQAWQERLTEESAWLSRLETEPLLVLADAHALKQSGITRGAYVILIAEEQTPEMAQAFRECSAWLMLGLDLKVMGSGRGISQTTTPILSMAAELAAGLGMETGEALRALCLVENDRFGEEEG